MAHRGLLYELHSEPVKALYSVQFRATQSLLEALVHQHKEGKEVVGTLLWQGTKGNNVISVGSSSAGQQWNATCVTDQNCDVVLMPKGFLTGAAGVAGELAQVAAKLHIQPELNDKTAQRYKVAHEEARAKQHERQTKVVDAHSKAASKAAAGRGFRIRHPTPPAPLRAPTPSAEAPAMLRAPTPTNTEATAPPLPKVPTQGAAGAPTGAWGAAALPGQRADATAKASLKPKGRSKTPPPLHRHQRPTPPPQGPTGRSLTPPPGAKGSAAPSTTVSAALKQAATTGRLSRVVALLLHEHPMRFEALRNTLSGVYQSLSLTVPHKDKIQSSLTQVADFKAPARYHLKPEYARQLAADAALADKDEPEAHHGGAPVREQAATAPNVVAATREAGGSNAANGKPSKKRKLTPDLQNGSSGNGPVVKRSNTQPVPHNDAAAKQSQKAAAAKSRSNDGSAANGTGSPMTHQRPPVGPSPLGYRDLSGAEPKIIQPLQRSAPGQRRVRLETLSDDDDEELPKATKRSPARIKHKGAFYALEPHPHTAPGNSAMPRAPAAEPPANGLPQSHLARTGSGVLVGRQHSATASECAPATSLSRGDGAPAGHGGYPAQHAAETGNGSKQSNGSSEGEGVAPSGPVSEDHEGQAGALVTQRSMQSGATGAVSGNGEAAAVNGVAARLKVVQKRAPKPPPIDQAQLDAFDAPYQIPDAATQDDAALAPITCKAQFDEYCGQYRRLHSVYQHMHSKLGCLREVLHQLHEDATAAAAEQDRCAWLQAYTEVWETRCDRAQQYDRAVKQLHENLTKLQAYLQSFVQQRKS